MEQAFSTGELLHEIRTVALENLRYALVVGGAIAGGYALLDLISERAGNLGSIVVTVFVQYLFLEHILRDRLNPEASSNNRRYGAMFGSGFVSTLGILVASIVFLLPGLYVAARWSLTSALVVTQRANTSEALSGSWEATQSCWKPIFIVVLGFFVAVVLLGGGVFVLADSLGSRGETLELILINLVVAACSVGGWILAAATFRLVQGDHAMLGEVFA